MPRVVDAQLVEAVRAFRRRRRWRHFCALLVGAVLLLLGSGVVGAHLVRHTPANTPALGVGVALYAAGVLLCAWGAAAGFTARLAVWLPVSAVLGVLTVLVLAVAAMFPGAADSVFLNGRPSTGSAGIPPRTSAPARSYSASGPFDGDGTGAVSGPAGHLASLLMDERDVARYLGPERPALDTPGAAVVRTRSLAVWHTSAASAVQDADSRGAPRRRPTTAMLSVTVQFSRRRARLLATEPGGRVRVHDTPWGRTTRYTAGRGGWVVTLQLRNPAVAGAEQALPGDAGRLLALLSDASAAATAR